MPESMRYDKQAILSLAKDTKETGDALMAKRIAAGDKEKTKQLDFFDWGGERSIEASFKDLTDKSRLVVVAHSSPKSEYLFTAAENGRAYKPLQLAELVESLLGGVKVRRISLHMCLGGGNRGAGVAADVETFELSPGASFAATFAAYCGSISAEVSARTDSTAIQEERTSKGVFVNAKRLVGYPVIDRHHGLGDKVIFYTDPASSPKNMRPAQKWEFDSPDRHGKGVKKVPL